MWDSPIFTCRVSGRGNIIGPMCVSVRLSGCTQGTLYTTIGSQVFEWVTLLQLFLGFRFTSIFHTYEKLVVQKLLSYDCESHIRNTRPCG